MDRSMKKDTTLPRCGDRLTFKYATFYYGDVHHRSPQVSHHSGRDKGGRRSRRLCSCTPHWYFACHALTGSSLTVSWECVCLYILSSSVLYRLGIPFRRCRSRQERTPLVLLFLRHNRSYLGMELSS